MKNVYALFTHMLKVSGKTPVSWAPSSHETIKGANDEVSSAVSKKGTYNNIHSKPRQSIEQQPKQQGMQRNIAMQQPFIGLLVRARSTNRREQCACSSLYM